MIVRQVTRTQVVEHKIYYQPLQQPALNSQPISPNIADIEIQSKSGVEQEKSKRLPDYKTQQDPSLQQTQSDMSGTNLARINSELEERTTFFTRHGKYDSKYRPERIDNFATGLILTPISPVSSILQYKPVPTITRQPYYLYDDYPSPTKLTPTHHIPPPTYQKPPSHSTNFYNSPPLSPSSPTHQEAYKDKQEEFYDLSPPKEMQQTFSGIKNKTIQRVHQSQQKVKQTAKEAVKVTEKQKFNFMKCVLDLIGQAKNNSLISPKNKKQKKEQPPQIKSPPLMSPSKAASQVSPLQYSQKAFSSIPEEFALFWVYGLVAVGFFLVFFQTIK